MQPWSGGRPGRERSSSVVLLGKLSAIVRRGSIFQVDPEDVQGSNSSNSSRSSISSNSSSNLDKESDEEKPPSAKNRHLRRSSVGATPTMQSNMTMWDPSESSNGRGANKRLQFYPARPLVAAALAKPLSHAELMRRATLEAMMGEFGEMHTSFAPPTMLPDVLEEKPEVEPTDEVMDNNELENLEEEERRAAHCSDGDVSSDDKSEEDNEDLLDFDHVNMPASVRTLVSRIKSESLLDEAKVPVLNAADTSNQNDEDEEYDEDVDSVDDAEDLDLDIDHTFVDQERPSNEEEEALIPMQELSPAEHRLMQRHRTRLLSCAHEQAALSAQDQLTSSVRRLVIELQDDSEQMNKPLSQSHGIRLKSKPPPTRRRAGSCPSAYDLGIPSPMDEPSMPTPPPISPTLLPQEMHPAKKHKKSAFSRIGPRVLETLHLRKKRKTYLFTDEELETIEGARWKIVELAFRFGGKHRSYLVQAINMFFPLLKYGRRGGAHATRLHCNCCGTLQWQHKRGGLSEAVDLAEVLQVLDGRQTGVFRKYPFTRVLDACSFSVVFRGRTLDLETQSSSHRDWLVSALRTLVAYARRQRRIEHQAIAERTILPLEDDLLPRPSPSAARATRLPSPLPTPNRRLDDAPMMSAMPPNLKIRTVY